MAEISPKGFWFQNLFSIVSFGGGRRFSEFSEESDIIRKLSTLNYKLSTFFLLIILSKISFTSRKVAFFVSALRSRYIVAMTAI